MVLRQQDRFHISVVSGLQPWLSGDAPLARSSWPRGVCGGIGRRVRDIAGGARSRGRRRGGYRRCSRAADAGSIAAVEVKELALKKTIDPFVKVREATLAHRAKHGCGTWPHSNGALLSALAATADAERILELGTALGYTALSFAH